MPAATAPDVTDDAVILDVEEVFRQHASMVYRTARAITGSTEDAEDIVQAVFLRLVRGDHAQKIRTNTKGYLYRAAVNLSLDALRSRRRRTFIRDLDKLESIPATDGFGGFSHDRLDAALAHLDPSSLEILILRYVHDFSDGDIATLLGTSRGAIALRLFRLRRRLKKLLSAPRGERP
jgi:RNA polymerase sigma-70 factor (ECF subfamily)